MTRCAEEAPLHQGGAGLAPLPLKSSHVAETAAEAEMIGARAEGEKNQKHPNTQ